MGFSSDDDLLNQITTNAKRLRVDGLSKITSPVHTAGGWHCLAGLNGFPNAGTYPGTDLVWSNCSDGAGDGTTIIGQRQGGVLGGTATKHLSMLGAMVVAAAGAPWQLKLVDLQGYYRLSTTNVTGTGSRVLVNTNTFTADAGTDLLTFANDWKTFTKVQFTTTTTLPAGLALATDYWLIRVSATTATVASSYANAVAGTFIDITDAGTGTHTLTIQMPRYADGAGCEAFFVVQTAPTGGGPNLTASSYTNAAGGTGRAFQGSPSMGAAADAYAARVLHSGNAAGRYGPFLPKQGADTGVARIASFTWSTGSVYTGSGVVALCIARPLCDIMLPATGAFVMEDLRNQLPSLPEIEEGACIVPMLFGTGATTANSPVNWITDFVWGG